MSGVAPDKLEHLKMLQDVIARMAGNSTQMKTWAVSLVTAAFVFSGLSDDSHWLVAAGGCVPVIAFWVMDARYLHLERCYIRFYEAIVAGTPVMLFDLNYRPYAADVPSIWRVARTWSVVGFYGVLLVFLLVLIAILTAS